MIGLGQCLGGSSFYELKAAEALKINNGSVLVNGRISWEWQNVMFWRTFVVMVLHYICILMTCSLSLRLGIVRENEVESQIQDVLDRPSDDTATMFAFVK